MAWYCYAVVVILFVWCFDDWLRLSIELVWAWDQAVILEREFYIDWDRALALARLEYHGSHGRLPYCILMIARHRTGTRTQFEPVRDAILDSYARKTCWNSSTMKYYTGDLPVFEPMPVWYNNGRAV